MYCNYILIETIFFLLLHQKPFKTYRTCFCNSIKIKLQYYRRCPRNFRINERLHRGGFAIFFCMCGSAVSRNVYTPAPGDSNNKVRDLIAIVYFYRTVQYEKKIKKCSRAMVKKMD